MPLGPALFHDLTDRSIIPIDASLQAVAETLLEDAYAMLTSADRTITTRLAEPAFSAELTRLIIIVQCAMVGRVARNPEGKLEESIDDYRYRLDAAVSTGALYFSADELAWLAAPSFHPRRGAFNIVLGSS